MSFTIQDMMLTAENRYEMKFLAGKNGWSNSISWVHLLEDTTIIQNFWGKELAVTTGLGFQTTEKLLGLLRDLTVHHAAGLIINVGNYIKEVPEGTSISYGGTYVTERKSRIATVPVGYGDGYPRSLSGVGSVLIRGRRARIVGRVCMDQFMVDVTDIEAEEFDKVTLLGRDGADEITADELGRLSGRFPYELVCDISPRVPRVYRNKE